MLVVIDGDCSFCQWASRILKRICKSSLEITSLKSLSPELIHRWESDPRWSVDSINVMVGNQLYIKSAAIAQIMQLAKWYAQPLRIVFLLPKNILDPMYDWVARNRKFGQSCELQ